MKILSKEQILLLHKHLIDISGGSYGIRDEGLLDSAINTPFQSFNDIELYLSVICQPHKQRIYVLFDIHKCGKTL